MVLRLIIAAGLMVLTLNGCTASGFRLNGNFNSQAFGAPQVFPIPSPPNDIFTWPVVTQPFTSVIVPNPAGGKWVRTTPTHAFIVDPDRMHNFMVATSERFNFGGPPMRGTFSIRLVGPGQVSFGVRAVRENEAAGFIGAGELFSSPFGGVGGEVGVVSNPSDIDNLDAWKFRRFPATSIGSYIPGQTAHFTYSIDPSNQTFKIGVGGGGQGFGENDYRFSGAIRQLQLWLFLRGPTNTTVVFTDFVTMEELPVGQ
jgi:hypothetical protein